MTLWQFACCAEGYKRAHNPEPLPPPPSDEKFEQMVARHLQLTGAS